MTTSVVPNRVRELRETLGQTREWLAERSGMTVRNVLEIEAGRRSPSIDRAHRIAWALQVRDVSIVFPPEERAA